MRYSIAQFVSLAAALLSSTVQAASPPTIICSTNQVLECTSSNGASGVVQATVRDADGDALMVVWAVNGQAALTNVLGAGATSNGVTLSFTNQFRFGTNDVSVGVTDDGINVVMCSSTVVVQDTTPPVILSLTATPNVIWPPNHKMKSIRLVVRAQDTCGPVSWEVDSIQSNESDDARGSGHTSPDWTIPRPHVAMVRAERSGGGSGRIYTIHVKVTDLANNSAFGTVQVSVPHDRGHGRAKHGADPGPDQGNEKGRGQDRGHTRHSGN